MLGLFCAGYRQHFTPYTFSNLGHCVSHQRGTLLLTFYLRFPLPFSIYFRLSFLMFAVVYSIMSEEQGSVAFSDVWIEPEPMKGDTEAVGCK